MRRGFGFRHAHAESQGRFPRNRLEQASFASPKASRSEFVYSRHCRRQPECPDREGHLSPKPEAAQWMKWQVQGSLSISLVTSGVYDEDGRGSASWAWPGTSPSASMPNRPCRAVKRSYASWPRTFAKSCG